MLKVVLGTKEVGFQYTNIFILSLGGNCIFTNAVRPFPLAMELEHPLPSLMPSSENGVMTGRLRKKKTIPGQETGWGRGWLRKGLTCSL